jgi:1,4-alpha-glucan branching enzyme
MSLQILADSPYYEQFAGHIEWRHRNYLEAKARIESIGGSLDTFTRSYEEFGLHYNPDRKGITYREWAPGAKEMHLCGDFNYWNSCDPETKCDRDDFGHFTLFLPDKDGQPAIAHNTKVRTSLVLRSGERVSRVSAWINYTYQNPENFNFDGVFWNPPTPYAFKHPRPSPPPSAP